MDKMVYAWLLGVIVLSAFEAISVSLTTIWPAFGCVVALIFERCGASLWVQIFAFFISSFVLYIVTKPIISKHFKVGLQKTNIDALVGEKCVVTSPINNLDSTGQIKIHGQIWSARSESGETFAAGDMVKSVRLQGVCMYVTAWEEPQQAEETQSQEETK